MQGFVTPTEDRCFTSAAEKDVKHFTKNKCAQTAARALCSLGAASCIEGTFPVSPQVFAVIIQYAGSSTLGNTWAFRSPPSTEDELDEQRELLWREQVGISLALEHATPRSVGGFLRVKRKLEAANGNLIEAQYDI